MQKTLAPSGTYRLDRRRTFALNLQPPRGMALQDTMAIIKKDVEPQIRKILPPDGTITYGAAADHLDNALWNMGKNFGLAVLLLFLIMAALFKSVWDAAIATIALPLGMVGGMAALRLLGLFVFQPLDLLTMIGFIIVLGLVVNNTILLVARTRQAEAEGMTRVDAVRSSLETRLRPIFSSTLTAIFGMLPLVLVPGPGAEIYRGLGAVIVGGILVSHVFTLVLMPAMLRLGEKPARCARRRARHCSRRPDDNEEKYRIDIGNGWRHDCRRVSWNDRTAPKGRCAAARSRCAFRRRDAGQDGQDGAEDGVARHSGVAQRFPTRLGGRGPCVLGRRGRNGCKGE